MEDFIALWVIIAIVIIVCDLIAAFKFGDIVSEKGYGEDRKGLVIFFCIFVPIAGYCMAIALPDRYMQANVVKTDLSEKGAGVENNDLPEL